MLSCDIRIRMNERIWGREIRIRPVHDA